MSRILRSSHQTESMEFWLRSHGFQSNPFAEQEAEREQERLFSYFIDTPFYQDILGDPAHPRSIVVHANRGCGKSAHRIMVGRACRPVTPQAGALAVTYTDFGRFDEQALHLPPPRLLQEHITAILSHVVETLIHLLVVDEETATLFPDEQLGRLKWYWTHFGTSANDPRYWFSQLRANFALNPSELDWVNFHDAWQSATMLDNLQTRGMGRSPQIQLLARLVDEMSAEGKHSLSRSPASLFSSLIEITQSTGVRSLYILVDQLEETSLLAGETERITTLLSPLVGELSLIEAPGVAFKFFIPHEVALQLMKRPNIRTDRVLFSELLWDEEMLHQLLRQRLISFSNGAIEDFGQLCEPDLARIIETEMIHLALGTPRRLLRIAETLVLTHCQQFGASFLLTRRGWLAAKERYSTETGMVAQSALLQPPLVLYLQTQVLHMGDRRITLSDTQYALLSFLAQYPGQTVSNSRLMNAAGSHDALRKSVQRIRQLIEPNPQQPVYLVTVRGEGLRLNNIIIER